MQDEHSSKTGEIPAHDRKVIRVEFPLAHAGIAAALQRAFKAAAEEPSDRDFESLLRRLH